MDFDKVVPSRLSKSPVWAYFTKYTTGAQCDECGMFLKTVNSTSSLLAHIRGHHKEIWVTLEHMYPARGPSPSRTRKKTASVPKFVVVEQPPSHQQQDEEGVKYKMPRLMDHAIVTVKTESQSEDIVIANLPFDMDEAGTSGLDSNEGLVIQQYVEAKSSHSQLKRKSQKPVQSPPTATTSSTTISINDALIDLVVMDELSLNVTELDGFRRYSTLVSPAIEMPSQVGLRRMLDQRYRETSNSIKCALVECSAYSLSISEWSDLLYGRNFMGITCNFIDQGECALRHATIGFEELPVELGEEELTVRVEAVLGEWGVHKAGVVSVTVLGTAPVIGNVFGGIFGQEKMLYCFAQSLNAVARRPFEDLPEIHALVDEIKVRTDFVKQGNEELMVDDTAEGQELWELMYSTNTSWKANFNQLSRFLKYAKRMEALLLENQDAPPMPTSSVMREIRDVVKVLKPLKGVCDDLCLDQYLMAGKVIPLVQCLLASLADTWPETRAGIATKELITEQINYSYADMEENEMYALGTLMDPRFKKNYFKNASARDAAIEKLKDMVAASGDAYETQAQDKSLDEEGQLDEADGIWKFHSSFVADQQTTNVDPVTLYLSTKVADLRNTNPLKYFHENLVDFRATAEKLFVSQATSAPAKKIFSEPACVLNSNWTALPVTDLRKLMFLASVAN